MTPQPHDIDRRLRAGDQALVGGVSINESHALLVGLALGFLAGRTGQPRVTLALGVALVAPWPRTGVGPRTLAREPWWALGGYLVGVVIGACRRDT